MLVLRFIATTMAYVEPILLMVRHTSISRKVIAIITRGRTQPNHRPSEISTNAATRSYFDALKKD
ncbi:hypothetical protein PMAYCL1PPCAC_08745, partial [Pristionchus mayeri]